MHKAVTVLLVDDHGILRSGLRALLQSEAGFVVAGEACNGREAIDLVKSVVPDVVVMDVRMPELNGIETTRQVIALHPGIKVIGLSANYDERTMLEMMRAGAAGYIAKESAYEELIAAIRGVMAGQSWYTPAAIARMAGDFGAAGNQNIDSAFMVLSPREREVLQLISEGRSTKEVAGRLSVSVKTAETHRRNLMEKLHLDSVAELTKYAIREGLTSV
jgi:two-component system response regulator NreC